MLEGLQANRVLGTHNSYVQGYKKGYTAGLKVILYLGFLWQRFHVDVDVRTKGRSWRPRHGSRVCCWIQIDD
jgi:hypothetical protein